MKLILLRNQNSGFTGKVSFSLTAKVETTTEEQDNIQKYKMGKTLLLTNIEDRGSGVLGLISRNLLGMELTVNDLVNGKTFECKDILEMMDYEKDIISTSKIFKEMLEMASTFGGETIIEI